uniref:Putative ovule protein n=1 Tax=Solanum chacoense TaxID=4108 RepID=A0A0V0HFS7_SOLCH
MGLCHSLYSNFGIFLLKYIYFEPRSMGARAPITHYMGPPLLLNNTLNLLNLHMPTIPIIATPLDVLQIPQHNVFVPIFIQEFMEVWLSSPTSEYLLH